MLRFDDARLAQYFGSNRGLAQLCQPLDTDDRVLLAEDIGKPALGHAPVQRHLAAFKSADHARSGARPLPFVATRRRLSHTGAHTAPHALALRRSLLLCVNIR